MITFSISALLKKMFIAVAEQSFDNWLSVSGHIEVELEKIAETLQWIIEEKQAGRLSEEQAVHNFFLQKNHSASWLSHVCSIGYLEASKILEIALDAIRTEIETAIEWKLF